MVDAVLAILRCPGCGARLTRISDRSGNASLACQQCAFAAPIVAGIPRFVEEPADALARRTAESFGYEWTAFGDWQPSGQTNFEQYFGDLTADQLAGRMVLDAGCGMGRHARQMAERAGIVVAMDFSRAIDQAARNAAPRENVVCVQGDVLRPPFADGAFDFLYCLGVLHHITDTEGAIRALAAKVRPGGRMRVYLYWKRHGVVGALLAGVAVVRRVTTQLPFAVLRVLCWVLAVALFTAVVMPYRLLSRLGVRRHESWPLFVYARYPFQVLYNDQFDRFSAPLEKRYDAAEVHALLRRAGLADVRVWPSFGWMAEGTRPESPT